MRRLFTIAASATVAATAALATGGLGFAGAETADSPVAPRRTGPTAAAQERPCRGRAVLGHTIHGDLIVGGEQRGYHPMTLDRGAVTAIDAASITIERPDGASVSAALTATTKYPGKARDEIAAGDKVTVMQAGGTARAVLARSEDRTDDRAGDRTGGAPCRARRAGRGAGQSGPGPGSVTEEGLL